MTGTAAGPDSGCGRKSIQKVRVILGLVLGLCAGCASAPQEKDLSITRDSHGNITRVTETDKEPVVNLPVMPLIVPIQEENPYKNFPKAK